MGHVQVTVIRPAETAYLVEQRCLPGAVRTDDPNELALVHMQGDVAIGRQGLGWLAVSVVVMKQKDYGSPTDLLSS